jgi:hypothetical protein
MAWGKLLCLHDDESDIGFLNHHRIEFCQTTIIPPIDIYANEDFILKSRFYPNSFMVSPISCPIFARSQPGEADR